MSTMMKTVKYFAVAMIVPATITGCASLFKSNLIDKVIAIDERAAAEIQDLKQRYCDLSDADKQAFDDVFNADDDPNRIIVSCGEIWDT